MPPPEHTEPEVLAASLLAIPNLRAGLSASSPAELAEIFDAFDIAARYDKRDNSPEIAATVIPELWTDAESKRPAQRGRSQDSSA